MTIHKYYIGGMGPHLYDDTEELLDPDEDFPDEDQHALVTDGQLIVEGDPTEDNNTVRLIDLMTMITETFTATGTIGTNTQMVLCLGTFDLFLPLIASGLKHVYDIKNVSTGVITLKPNAVEPTVEIENEIYQSLNPGDSVTVYGDVLEWWVR